VTIMLIPVLVMEIEIDRRNNRMGSNAHKCFCYDYRTAASKNDSDSTKNNTTSSNNCYREYEKRHRAASTYVILLLLVTLEHE
jgi:hypothetical protein